METKTIFFATLAVIFAWSAIGSFVLTQDIKNGELLVVALLFGAGYCLWASAEGPK